MDAFSSSDTLAAEIRQLIGRRVPGLADTLDLPDDTALGETGIGLDSVAIVELLLESEVVFDVRLPRELLDGVAVTIGGLAFAIARAHTAKGRAGG